MQLLLDGAARVHLLQKDYPGRYRQWSRCVKQPPFDRLFRDTVHLQIAVVVIAIEFYF